MAFHLVHASRSFILQYEESKCQKCNCTQVKIGHRSQVISSKLIHVSTTPTLMFLSLFHSCLVRHIICINFLHLVPSYNQWGHLSIYQLSILRDRGDGNGVFFKDRYVLFLSVLRRRVLFLLFRSALGVMGWIGSVAFTFSYDAPRAVCFSALKGGPSPQEKKCFDPLL